MNAEELLNLGAEKAYKELTWESIEFLFKPQNMGALLLRLDPIGMEQLVYEAFSSTEPNAMPFRFRGEFWPAWERTIMLEKFYIKLKLIWDKKLT